MVAMREFIVGFNLLSNRNGQLVTDTPVVPLKILADSAVQALEFFVRRSEGTIVSSSRHAGADAIEARVSVDDRIFRVRVCDSTLLVIR